MSDIHLSGFLFNASGAAVNGATVEAFAKNTVTETGGTAVTNGSTTTNSSGYYTMTVTSDNEHDIRITSGNSVRWKRFDDRLQLEELEVSTFNIREGATAQVYTIAPGSISADRTLTLPAATGDDTLASLGMAQTFSAAQTFTGTVTVGSDGSGTDVIFYSGTSGDNLTWDASEEVLNITGTDGATALDVKDGDVVVVDKIYLYDRGGEYLSSDGSTLTITGATTVSGGLTSTAASNTLGATSFNDAAITNVGDIALDSISADGTDINIAVTDNSATALTIKQGSDAYLVVDTANSSESVSIGTGISGTAITIGHSTSETTVADNLTVTGDMTVNGTTTTVNSTTLTVDDPIITLGGDTAPGSDDNKDRGVEFRYHDGSSARVGFFGYDDSASVFTGLTAATNSSEVFSGTVINAIFGDIGGTLTTAAQTAITSLGTLTALTVDDVAVNGKVITMTGSAGDTAVFTVGTAGTLSLVTTDAAGTDADLSLDADGQITIDANDAAGIFLGINGTNQINLVDGVLKPVTDNDVDLGVSGGPEFKNGYFNGTLEADAVTIGGTNVVTGSLVTTLGTVTAGVWNGTTVAVANGGTGATSLTDKAVLISQDTGTDTVGSVALTTSGQVIIGGSSGPAAATLTAGSNITISNGDGSISIASAAGGPSLGLVLALS
jgi:hypothetical protein